MIFLTLKIILLLFFWTLIIVWTISLWNFTGTLIAVIADQIYKDVCILREKRVRSYNRWISVNFTCAGCGEKMFYNKDFKYRCWNCSDKTLKKNKSP